MKKIIGMIVAPAGVTRDGYQLLLSSIPGVDVVEAVENEPSVGEKLEKCKPDLLLLESGQNLNETLDFLEMMRFQNLIIDILIFQRPKPKLPIHNRFWR